MVNDGEEDVEGLVIAVVVLGRLVRDGASAL
jgi:hypothetical protein